MFMKKRITFIATLLILACVALAGSSAWAAQSMKPEDVIAYDKSDPNSAPCTMISTNNDMIIYYKGTGYSSILGNDIAVTIFRIIVPATDISEAVYDSVNTIPIMANTSDNVCNIDSGGVIEGHFKLTETNLTYYRNNTRFTADKIEVYITGMPIVNGNQIRQAFLVQPYARVRLDNSTFMPKSQSEIRTFFTTSIEVQEPWLTTERDTDYGVYSWLQIKKTEKTDLEYFANVEHSAEFGNPSFLTLNPQSRSLAVKDSGSYTTWQYDLKLLTRDLAGNLVVPLTGSNPDPTVGDPEYRGIYSSTVSFRYHAVPGGSDDAYTRLDYLLDSDGKPLNKVQYVVYIPKGAFTTTTGRPVSGDYQYCIGGKSISPEYKSVANLPWDPNSRGAKNADFAKNYDIFKIGGPIDVDSASMNLLANVNDLTLRSKSAVTVGMTGVDAATNYTYFGAADRVGPILLKAQIDEAGKRTVLTFSESLNKTISLDKADFMINGYSYKDKYPSGTISYDSASDNKIVLGAVLREGDLIKVVKNNHVKDKLDNRAESWISITVRLGRVVDKVEVIDVFGNYETRIRVTFNDVMQGMLNKEYYRVTVTPGLEKLADKTTGLITPYDVKKPSDPYFTPKLEGEDDQAVILIINGKIEDTSAKGLPQVMISDYGMDNLKGTTGETLITNHKGEASLDAVGPYITDAVYNRHATDLQPALDISTYHVMTLTFSEPIQCKYLYSPRAILKIEDTNIAKFGRDSVFVQQGDQVLTKVDIEMGEDTSVYGKKLDKTLAKSGAKVGIYEDYKDIVKDAGGNGASTLSVIPIPVVNMTPPWITKVTTQDLKTPKVNSAGALTGIMNDGFNGTMDTLLLTWSEDISKEFSNKELVNANTKVKDGYYLNPNMPIDWTDRNPIEINGNKMTLPLKEKRQGYDTNHTPGFSLYLDSLNYLRGTIVGPDGLYYQVTSPIEVLSSKVTDGVPPYPVKISHHLETNGTYTVRVTYSEVIDPNVYQSTGDPYSNAAKDFAAYDVTTGTDGKSTVTSATPNANVIIGDYITSSCTKDTLAFRVTLATGYTGSLATVTFAPKYDKGNNGVSPCTEGAIDGITDSGIFDMAGNLAKSGSTLEAADVTVVASTEFNPFLNTDPILLHKPKMSANFMMLHGTVTDVDGAPVCFNSSTTNNKWSIYAYSLDNLYRFKHKSRYPLSAGTAGTNVFLSKAEHDPNCVKNCSVAAILAPTNAVEGITGSDQGGVCYGSAAIQGDGQYTMYVYNEFFDTPGFKEGDPIFLVVQAPDTDNSGAHGKKYLVTNNVKGDDFYLTFSLQANQGIKQYNIDLRTYESKSLINGWNFVSFSTLKRYVLSGAASSGNALRDEMNNPISNSICPVVTVSNLSNVLTSLTGQWSKVYFVDGAKDAASAIRITSRDPKTGVESGLDRIEYFSVGNGYWIYIPTVKSGTELVVLGQKVTDNDPPYHMALTKNDSLNGVNMVGYWGGQVYYIVDPLGVNFSSLVMDAQGNLLDRMKSSVSSISDVFEAFSSGLSLLRCSYESGPQSWYSPVVYGSFISGLSDLSYVGPGYGYYMVIDQDCNVSWPLVLK